MTADRDTIRMRLNAITPGEWLHDGVGGVFISGKQIEPEGYLIDCISTRDAEFIAHAPADLHTLLDQHDTDEQRIAHDDLVIHNLTQQTHNQAWALKQAQARIAALEGALREIVRLTPDKLEHGARKLPYAAGQVARAALKGGDHE